jgi:hypothetical protein
MLYYCSLNEWRKIDWVDSSEIGEQKLWGWVLIIMNRAISSLLKEELLDISKKLTTVKL